MWLRLQNAFSKVNIAFGRGGLQLIYYKELEKQRLNSISPSNVNDMLQYKDNGKKSMRNRDNTDLPRG